MMNCSRVRPLLPLSARGDLRPADLKLVRSHTATCAACREEEAGYSRLISAARACQRADDQLPAALRNRIALEAARAVRERPWAFLLAFPMEVPGRRLIAGAAAAVIALVLVAGLRHKPVPAQMEAGAITNIQVLNQGEAVRLAWSDGRKGSYTVYKSDDPRRFSRSEAHVVTGNVWVDTNPGSSPVVFYRIE